MHRIASFSAAALACMTLAPRASAHVCMVAPVPRVGASCNAGSPQKVGPCGVNERGGNVTVFRPGETITVLLNETIGHESHYRIAFNPSGDDFEDPTSKDDKDGNHPFVLKDGITDEALDDGYPDNPSITQSVQVTLPNTTCESCTLQLIQVMYDKGGNGFGGNDGTGGKADNDDMYYACADIALRGEPVGPGQDGGASTADAGVPTGSDGGAGPAGDSGATAGAAGGTGTAGAGGTTSGTNPENSDDEEQGGCECGIANNSTRHRGLFGTGLLVLGLLVRWRRLRLRAS